MWFRRYGLKVNPFVIQPQTKVFVGFEEIKDRIFEAIESNDIAFVKGPFGSGKTTLLLWLRGLLNYGGYVPIYLDGADFQLSTNLKELYGEINSHVQGGFFEKLKNALTGRKRKVVFLIDEADSIPKGLGEILKADKDRGFIYSVVFASAKGNLENLSPSLAHRIVECISLRTMNFEEAMGMIERRIEEAGGKNFFEPKALEYICKVSKWLPRDILKNCETIAKELAYKKRKSILIEKKDAVKILKKGRKRKRFLNRHLSRNCPILDIESRS